MSDNRSNDKTPKTAQPLAESPSEEIAQDVESAPRGPDLVHAFARSALGIKLTYVDWALQSIAPEWSILDQPKILIKNHMLLPDLAGWECEDFSSLSEQAVIESVPDWIGEVLSSTAGENDRVVKMPLYARLGVKYFWVVNPNLRTLKTYRLENQNWCLVASYKDDDKVCESPFDSFGFPLNNLWST
ncbi:MAG: Uma2 family endonuclease [Gammaproteobacteria bacterium]|nr:Uma2 family endonuclease [Gammaproteobacteria bacterium]